MKFGKIATLIVLGILSFRTNAETYRIFAERSAELQRYKTSAIGKLEKTIKNLESWNDGDEIVEAYSGQTMVVVGGKIRYQFAIKTKEKDQGMEVYKKGLCFSGTNKDSNIECSVSKTVKGAHFKLGSLWFEVNGNLSYEDAVDCFAHIVSDEFLGELKKARSDEISINYLSEDKGLIKVSFGTFGQVGNYTVEPVRKNGKIVGVNLKARPSVIFFD